MYKAWGDGATDTLRTVYPDELEYVDRLNSIIEIGKENVQAVFAMSEASHPFDCRR